jgi:hypothetical protein
MVDFIGATVRSRTADILITSEVLYQLSYGGQRSPKLNLRNMVVFFERVNYLFSIISKIHFKPL